MNKDRKQHELAGLSGFYADESSDILPSFQDITNSKTEEILSSIMEVVDTTKNEEIKKDSGSK